MSDGFGQRVHAPREGLRSIQGVKFERITDGEEANPAASPLRRLMFWIGAIALMTGIFFATRSLRPEFQERLWKNPEPATAQAYVPAGVKDTLLEQVNEQCRLRGAGAGRRSGDGVLVEQAAAYVACLAGERPRRLCQLTHRTHLLAAMRNYYGILANTRDRNAGSDPHVAEALKALVTNGLVPRRDLVAAAAQSDLAAVLHGIEAGKAGCGGGSR